ncbi:F0F1 ATP synthase subunit A [Aeromicrobium phragmitis]|nr:F0F1 ATP synthase subunit A [Aeromicrobium phragmitis]
MTIATVISAASGGEGFAPPGPADFHLPPLFGEVTKPMLLVVLAAVLVFAFTYLAARPAAVVPGRLQFAGEYVYGFVRNGIARESIGSEHFMKFVPYLFALFLFVAVNNYFGLVPFIQYPPMSHFGFPLGLALLTWILYIGVGIGKHGFLGYLKHITIPSGVKGPVLAIIIPLEFLSNILVRPATLSLRLFANMFAGHLLLMLFAFGGEYLLFESTSLINGIAGVLSFVMFGAVTVLELLIMFLQAYVFTLLTATYLGESLADEH